MVGCRVIGNSVFYLVVPPSNISIAKVIPLYTIAIGTPIIFSTFHQKEGRRDQQRNYCLSGKILPRGCTHHFHYIPLSRMCVLFLVAQISIKEENNEYQVTTLPWQVFFFFFKKLYCEREMKTVQTAGWKVENKKKLLLFEDQREMSMFKC